jgi:hypothetical protein
MSANRPARRKQTSQQGYALMLVVIMMALVVIATTAVQPNILINGRREKEEEMIWRGKQYVRGIRLFVRYNQMHGGQTRFPTSMDDLTKNKLGIRFMRQAYKDPVNSVDGSWRLIYVGPNGQLIGSLKARPLGTATGFGTGGAAGGFGSLFGNPSQNPAGSATQSGSAFGGSSFGNSSFGNSSFGSSSFGNSSFGNSANPTATNPATPGESATPGATTASGSGTNAQETDATTDQMSTPQSIANSDTPTEVIGGNIIGVGSKVNQSSIIWYDRAKNYRQFEFIWDPSKEPLNGGANAGVIGVPQQPANSLFGGSGGGTGFGQQPQPGGNTGFGGNPPPPASGPGQPPPGQNPPQQ